MYAAAYARANLISGSLCYSSWCNVFRDNMMRNARFGPLTLLMTLRVIDVKSDDKF